MIRWSRIIGKTLPAENLCRKQGGFVKIGGRSCAKKTGWVLMQWAFLRNLRVIIALEISSVKQGLLPVCGVLQNSLKKKPPSQVWGPMAILAPKCLALANDLVFRSVV